MFQKLTKIFTMPRKAEKLTFSISGNGILHVKSSDLIKSKKFKKQVEIVKAHSKGKK